MIKYMFFCSGPVMLFVHLPSTPLNQNLSDKIKDQWPIIIVIIIHVHWFGIGVGSCNGDDI